MRKLINWMVMTVFERLCQCRFQADAMAPLNAPSPLPTAARFTVINAQVSE